MLFPTWQSSLMVGANYAYAQVAAYLPRMVGAILLLIIGIIVARIIRQVVVRGLEAIRLSSWLEKTPLDSFVQNAEVGQKIEGVVGAIVYWLLMLVVLHATFNLLGLMTLVNVLDAVFSYLPHVASALLIFLFGVLFAGVVESLVKGTVKTVDPSSNRFFAKVASYIVVAVAGLAAISELGIASEFIRILFIGLVFAFSLAVGLAGGLGGQEVVRKMLERWYSKNQE